MKIVTGAAGFIGSCMVSKLNQEKEKDIIIVDDFSRQDRKENWENKQYIKKIDRKDFIEWFKENAKDVDGVFHLGARTDTTEFDWDIFLELNLNYTKDIWNICADNKIPMIYASSAATYGAGEQGYDDDINKIPLLKPLNPYGKSKQEFDIWQLQQDNKPSFWAGLKFFNVYGPNEYHKKRMASVILHSFEQINKEGKVSLFRSHKQGYKDGWQLRDFVYVKDLVNIMYFLMKEQPKSDIYNIGTGKARSFYDLADNTFKSMEKQTNIEFVDMPIDIRDKYQYFTEAKMAKLRSVGYNKTFYTLEEGVKDYVQNYLIGHRYF
ncbi:MAG: ADP-glyceromanno-heptose 6-epimerase [Bacteroidales bacterium]|jgi:ADP-L-glycero-D-manno-heptose 6-epimerase|nr:ADP-glyceromanno-heptose 6-epimerase [Bacteroidales bacterium]